MPWEKTENEIRQPIRDAGDFVDKSFRTKDLGEGIRLVLGKLKSDPDGAMIAQSVRFDKSKWSIDDAKKWFNEHKKDFREDPEEERGRQPQEEGDIEEEHKAKKTIEKGTVKDVEIFASGTWNGDKYTNDDLDDMIKAFNENKERMKPYLKLGHDDNQILLQKDGYPAAGWVDNLKRVGNKLVADFIDIPKKVAELIENKAYNKVSSEIYWNIKIGGKLYKKMLSAVALLGANTPAVSSLNDILSLYGFKPESLKVYAENQKEDNIKLYEINFDEEKKMEEKNNEIKKMEEETKKMEEKIKKLELENKELKTSQEEIKKEKNSLEEKIEMAEREKAIAALEKENLVTPSMKPYVNELLGAEKKEYTLDEKKYSKLELLKETLKLYKAASDVNFDENSEDGQAEKEDLHEKIEKYAKENDLSYSEAYKKVIK